MKSAFVLFILYLYNVYVHGKLFYEFKKQNIMEELIEKWTKRMLQYRNEADNTKSNIQRIKAMSNFMMLRDCIKELKKI